ncbi:hypothetical protein PVV74_17560 [Roseovarius sp. SK2]|uniref:TA system antitoxin ParD family protein n=1 Tax=Roseovarius TaxID=74030 RepID=UPI00237C44DC|nr:hypothetical protein [Roseovarius sp. SK2]MDD9727270.1 hypothetical protein [Roseovarius sp. SK2]
MAKFVEFTDVVFIDDARAVSVVQRRSLAEQIMHWARIGRAIERSGRFEHNKISRALAGDLETGTLTAEEKAVWSEAFLEKMSNPGFEEKTFFADLRTSGAAAGLDAAGRIVRADEQSDG